jgi:hypothetical protein
MGINTLKIGAGREAFELTCDSFSHGDNAPRAWFDSGSLSGSAWLAVTVGWKEYRRKGVSAWLYPRCADASAQRGASRLAGVNDAKARVERSGVRSD